MLLRRGGKLLLRGSPEGASGLDGSAADQVATIADVRHSSEQLPVYNLEVANAHTFFVGEDGVLVHNAHVPPPKGPLPGWPGSTPIGNRGGRASWDMGDGTRGSWDYQHGEVEVYGKDKKHKGAYDPKTGNRIKPPKKGRRCPPGLF